MKIYFSIFLTLLLLFVGCDKVSMEETGTGTDNFIIIKADPPAVSPGDEINIFAVIDNGTGTMGKGLIRIGNHIFADSSMATVKIPTDISGIFGDEAAKTLRNQKYVDVPVTIESDTASATKYFRIKGSGYEPSLYDENPVIDSVSYKTADAKTEIDPDGTIMFDPDDVPEKIDLAIEEITINENITSNFTYTWYVFGTGDEVPEIIESDETDGSAAFSFRDSGNAPVIGNFRFYLVVKPDNTYPLSYEARYCADFITFTVNTTGDADTTEEDPDTSETEDNEVLDI